MSRPYIELLLSRPPFDGRGSSGEAFYDVVVDGHRYKAFSIKYLHDAKLMAKDLAENFEKLGIRAYISPDIEVPNAAVERLAEGQSDSNSLLG